MEPEEGTMRFPSRYIENPPPSCVDYPTRFEESNPLPRFFAPRHRRGYGAGGRMMSRRGVGGVSPAAIRRLSRVGDSP